MGDYITMLDLEVGDLDEQEEDLCPVCNRPLDEWGECQVCINGDGAEDEDA